MSKHVATGLGCDSLVAKPQLGKGYPSVIGNGGSRAELGFDAPGFLLLKR
jgi:hypothetical protein